MVPPQWQAFVPFLCTLRTFISENVPASPKLREPALFIGWSKSRTRAAQEAEIATACGDPAPCMFPPPRTMNIKRHRFWDLSLSRTVSTNHWSINTRSQIRYWVNVLCYFVTWSFTPLSLSMAFWRRGAQTGSDPGTYSKPKGLHGDLLTLKTVSSTLSEKKMVPEGTLLFNRRLSSSSSFWAKWLFVVLSHLW